MLRVRVRRRLRESPNPDLRPGRQAAGDVAALQPGERSVHRQERQLYAIDSESSGMRHPGWKTGVRTGATKEDKVLAFIPPHQTENAWGAAGEGVAVDPDG